MGFWEVLVNLGTILGNLSFCKKDILQFKPDAVILVDYPGFNLRIAKFLKAKGIRVFYYISPQVWAWHSSRVKQIKECVDRMFVILPFEKEFYAKWNYDVDFVGYPLLDALADFRFNENFLRANHLEQKKIIAILSGSRKQEIKRMLPVMAEMANHFPDYQFVVAGLSHIGDPFYRQYLHHPEIKLIFDQTYDLLHHSFAAIVTSGTATMETALLNVPQVVCYKGNFFSYMIGRMLVEVQFIAMVNLICGKKVVEELIQHDLTTENLRIELEKILSSQGRERAASGYKLLRERLGGAGASKRAAEAIVAIVRQR
jgi:lipid-A-disaccharide synthase